MSTKLNPSEWTHKIPRNLDETTSIDHEGCGDTRSRLYITNKGKVALAFCQNCQRSGVYRSGTGRVSYRDAKSFLSGRQEGTDGRTVIKLPDDLDYDVEAWPVEARVWVRRYGITDEELDTYRIGYSKSIKRVIIPYYDGGMLRGYQGRAVFDGQQPKYLTCKVRGDHTPFTSNWHSARKLVLVEDALSCIKVGRVTNALALSTTHMPDLILDRVLDQCYTEVVVWLDNDNIEVKAAMLKIYRKLEPFCNVRIITECEGVDPKELSTTKIKEILE